MSQNDPRLASPVPAIQRTGARAKYRPSLTAEQITHILYLAKTEVPHLSKASMSLIATLAPFQAKIENEGIAAAYITSGKPPANSLEALGAAEPTEPVNKEAYWEACYSQWVIDPTSLTLKELAAVNEHRYLNDLMTSTEEKEYEQSSTGTSK